MTELKILSQTKEEIGKIKLPKQFEEEAELAVKGEYLRTGEKLAKEEKEYL